MFCAKRLKVTGGTSAPRLIPHRDAGRFHIVSCLRHLFEFARRDTACKKKTIQTNKQTQQTGWLKCRVTFAGRDGQHCVCWCWKDWKLLSVPSHSGQIKVLMVCASSNGERERERDWAKEREGCIHTVSHTWLLCFQAAPQHMWDLFTYCCSKLSQTFEFPWWQSFHSLYQITNHRK